MALAIYDDFVEDFDHSKSSSSNQRNYTKIEKLAIVCERYGVSNNAAAAFASTTLSLFGNVTNTNNSNVIDPSKLKRAREKIKPYTSRYSYGFTSTLRNSLSSYVIFLYSEMRS